MAVRNMTPEQREQIINDCEGLSGTVYNRATSLSKKYGFHRCTIQYLIKNLPCIDRIGGQMTEAEKARIKELFDASEFTILNHTVKHISKIVNRSPASIRKVIIGSAPDSEKMYNPIDHPFF